MAKLTELVETTPQYETVCGITFKVEEFNMQTRAIWLEEVAEYGLDELQRKVQEEVIPGVAQQAGAVENHPHIKSLNKRFVKLTKKHEKLMNLYGEDDEPEDIDEQIADVTARMTALSEELEEIAPNRVNQAIEITREGRAIMEEFIKKQDEARLHFAWRLASAAGRTDEDFESFMARAKPDDYDAVERFVNLGNAGWAELLQNRQGRRTARKNRTTTSSTVKPSQPVFRQSDLAN